MSVTKTVNVELSPLDLATAFCEMTDEEQAQFFIECARVVRGWEDTNARHLQFMEVGSHLRDCACSNDDAREMINDIQYGMRAARPVGR